MIQQLVGEVENAVSRVKERRNDVKIRREENLNNLNNAFNALCAAIDKHQQQLRKEITGDSEEKDKDLQVQEDELCSLLCQLKSCHSFVEDKVQRRVNQLDVLAMKKSMLNRKDELTELKEKTKMYLVMRNQLPANLKQMDEIIYQVDSSIRVSLLIVILAII